MQAGGNLVSLSVFAAWGISQGPSRDGCGWGESLGVGYQCRSEGPKLHSTIEEAAETRFLPLFILLIANQPHFIFPALEVGDKPLAKSLARVTAFTS